MWSWGSTLEAESCPLAVPQTQRSGLTPAVSYPVRVRQQTELTLAPLPKVLAVSSLAPPCA